MKNTQAAPSDVPRKGSSRPLITSLGMMHPFLTALSDLLYPFFGIKEQQFLMPVILFDDVRISKMQQIAVTVFFTHLQRIKDMHCRPVCLDLLSKRCYKVGIELLLHAFLGYGLHRIGNAAYHCSVFLRRFLTHFLFG